MLSVLWQVSSVLMGAGLLLVGSSLLSILLPLSMSRAGFSTELTGLVMSSYYAGLMLGSKYGLAVIMRFGHIRAFAGFAAIVCASVLAHPLWIDVAPWIALRLVCGFCLAGLFAVMESWLNDSSTNATRGRVLSIYLMTNYIAMTVGQLLVNVWSPRRRWRSVSSATPAAARGCLSAPASPWKMRPRTRRLRRSHACRP